MARKTTRFYSTPKKKEQRPQKGCERHRECCSQNWTKHLLGLPNSKNYRFFYYKTTSTFQSGCQFFTLSDGELDTLQRNWGTYLHHLPPFGRSRSVNHRVWSLPMFLQKHFITAPVSLGDPAGRELLQWLVEEAGLTTKSIGGLQAIWAMKIMNKNPGCLVYIGNILPSYMGIIS